MSERITVKHLRRAVDNLNKQLGFTGKLWNREGNRNVATVGMLAIDGNIGGWTVEQIVNESGAVRALTGRGSVREVLAQLRAIETGIQLAANRAGKRFLDNPRSRLHKRGRRYGSKLTRGQLQVMQRGRARLDKRNTRKDLKGAATWSVWGLDVWGNAEDGYDVNDRFRIARLKIPSRASAYDRTLFEYLKAHRIISSAAKFDHAEFGGDDTLITIDYDGKPELQLERE